MKEVKNNLMKGVERLSKLVAHLKSLNGEVSMIERDLLLQELREVYMEVLSMEIGAESSTVEGEKDDEEVVAFENIMQDVSTKSLTGFATTKSEEATEENIEEPIAEENVEELVEEEKIEKPVVEEKVDVVEKMVETPKEEAVVEEESPFAPAEPEPEMEPAPEPVMEEIEGNQYEELFEEPKAEEEFVREEVKVEAEPIKSEEVKVESPKIEEKVEEPKVVEEKKEVEEKKVEPKHMEKKHQTQPEQPSLFDYLSQPVSSTVEKTVAPTTTLADKFGVNKNILETQLEQKVNRHKVEDLRTVININDKFSFMTELFHNNMKAYNDFILTLNAMDDKTEAMKYVENVGKQNGWEQGSLSVTTFYKILERKF